MLRLRGGGNGVVNDGVNPPDNNALRPLVVPCTVCGCPFCVVYMNWTRRFIETEGRELLFLYSHPHVIQIGCIVDSMHAGSSSAHDTLAMWRNLCRVVGNHRVSSDLNGCNGEWTNADDVSNKEMKQADRKRANKEAASNRFRKGDIGKSNKGKPKPIVPIVDLGVVEHKENVPDNPPLFIGPVRPTRPAVRRFIGPIRPQQPPEEKTAEPVAPDVDPYSRVRPDPVITWEDLHPSNLNDSRWSGHNPMLDDDVIDVVVNKDADSVDDDDDDEIVYETGKLYYTQGDFKLWGVDIVFLVLMGVYVLWSYLKHTKTPVGEALYALQVSIVCTCSIVFYFKFIIGDKSRFKQLLRYLYYLRWSADDDRFVSLSGVADRASVTPFNLLEEGGYLTFDGSNFKTCEDVRFSRSMYQTLSIKHPSIKVNVNTISTMVQTLHNEHAISSLNMNLVQTTALVYMQDRRRQLAREKMATGVVAGFQEA